MWEETLPEIYLLLGMQMLVAAWDGLTTKTIANCFWKSKISSESLKVKSKSEKWNLP